MARNRRRRIGQNAQQGAQTANEGKWAFMPTKGTIERAEMPGRYNSEEVVLYGEACRCGTGAYPKLMVDGVEVPLDGAWAKEESLGNLGVGETFGH